MKISIVINNYNYATFVGQSIESALEQSHSDVEVIVVDDCSTDNSPAIIGRYGERVIPILKRTNAGHAAAFNSGFAASSGDLVMFLDADDFLYPHAASTLLAAWRPGVGMIQGLLDLVDVQGRRIGAFPADPGCLERGVLAPALIRRGRIEAVVTSGLAFDRRVLGRIMPVPEQGFRQGADGYLASVAPLFGEVAVCARSIAAYRQHGSNHSQFAKGVAVRARWQIEHDRHRHAAIRAVATSIGLAAPEDMAEADDQHLGARLASLRLDPANHPVRGDRARRLAGLGARASLTGPGALSRRSVQALWFVAAGNLPLSLAKPTIEWWLLPSTRPFVLRKCGRILKRALRRFRAVQPMRSDPG